MKCAVCRNGETKAGTATVNLERDNMILVVRGVPARVCDNCGEEYVEEAYVCRLLPLTCLAPDIAGAIVDGRQPSRRCSERRTLRRSLRPADEPKVNGGGHREALGAERYGVLVHSRGYGATVKPSRWAAAASRSSRHTKPSAPGSSSAATSAAAS